jgi:guanylate kinase
VQGARQVRATARRRRDSSSCAATLARCASGSSSAAATIRAAIATRLAIARRELEEGARFDYAVVNDRLETCVASVLAILAAERSGDTARLRARHAPGPRSPRLLAPRAKGARKGLVVG